MKRIICIFSDESGVFNRKTNQYFVQGGLILDASNGEVGEISRLYSKMESNLRKKEEYRDITELKASSMAPQDRRAMFATLRPYRKFGIVINLNYINPYVFKNKKTCQRYQDYAYSDGLASAFLILISRGVIDYQDEVTLHFIADEHHTATDSKYELREMLMQLFKEGGFSPDFMLFHKPIFKKAGKVSLTLADSQKNVLVRAADMIANRIYFEANHGNMDNIADANMLLFEFPKTRKE